jgi:hypothetical protein
VSHPAHGEAVIRDNGPLNEPQLAASLVDIEVPQA